MVLALLSLAGISQAHDAWVQSNVSRVRTGDMVYLDMQFCNHGNTHRDYKIWGSKWDVTKTTFILHTPRGTALDLKANVADIGVNERKQ